MGTHHLDQIGILRLFQAYGVTERAHGQRRIVQHSLRHLFHGGRLHQRFVSLHVHINICGVEFRHFNEPV